MRRMISIFHVLIFMALPVFLHAQADKVMECVKEGDALREAYRFEESVDMYRKAMDMFVDSLMTADDSLLRLQVSDRMLLSENGISMMGFAYAPQVVAKHRFHIDEFYLYYPLPDRSWRKAPCQLDSAAHALSRAVFIEDDRDDIFWSAVDNDGVRNIYYSEYQDTVWAAPRLLNEHVVSVSDEIYPMLSSDGRKLYFASSGLYGVGGQDLYVSEWDESVSDWSVPVNMGFPYSSPADDFLLAESDDGRYTVFASNRDCPADSVWVYVMEYDDMPVRHAVTGFEELQRLASLDPVSSGDNGKEVTADIPENVDTRRYMQKMSQVRSLRDTISSYGMKVEDARVRYGQTSDPKAKSALEEEILKLEMLVPALQDSLDKASVQLQEIEMEFLFSGVVIDPDKLLAEADREMVSHADYVFTRKSHGDPLALDMLDPEPEFDYTFKILPEGQFAEDNTLPEGLVYQIQMFSTYTKATVRQLKGLSPVFESVASNGRYAYRVGLFADYSSVLSNLNAVKRAGFRNAFIVAFNNGKELSVSKAKALEAQKKKAAVMYQVRIVTGSHELDMAIADGIRQQAAGKDIARSVNDEGANVYIVSPFADKASAEKLAGFVRAMGVSNAECMEIPQK